MIVDELDGYGVPPVEGENQTDPILYSVVLV